MSINQSITHLTTKHRVTAAVVALGVATSSLLAACGTPPEPQTVVIAVTATANEPAPSLSDSATKLLRTAMDSDDASGTLITVADGQPVTVDGSIDLRLLRKGSDQIENNADLRDKAADEITAMLQGKMLAIDPAQGNLDMLGLLTGVGRRPGPATVLVVSSGVQGNNPVSLGVLGFDFDPDAVVDDLQARHLMPTLSGKTVVFTGMGDVAGAQPALTTPARTAVENLWLAVCRRADAVSCEVDRTPTAPTPPTATTPVPVVPVPDLSTLVINPPADAPLTEPQALPSDLLFQPNSADLQPGADQALKPLADRILAAASDVHLVGHVWKVTDNDDRTRATELSTERAQAVHDLLVALGVPAERIVEVRGAGFDEPIALPGPSDPQQVAAANRVVEVVLAPAAG